MLNEIKFCIHVRTTLTESDKSVRALHVESCQDVVSKSVSSRNLDGSCYRLFLQWPDLVSAVVSRIHSGWLTSKCAVWLSSAEAWTTGTGMLSDRAPARRMYVCAVINCISYRRCVQPASQLHHWPNIQTISSFQMYLSIYHDSLLIDPIKN